MPDRSSLSLPLLQSSTKEKDGRSKEELLKLLNGNSADAADRVSCFISKSFVYKHPFEKFNLQLMNFSSIC